MNNETAIQNKRYPLKDIEDVFQEMGMLERIRTIVDTAIKDSWKIGELKNILDREISLVEDEVSLSNRKARDNIVRRELGLDNTVILTGKEHAQVFSLWKPQPKD